MGGIALVSGVAALLGYSVFGGFSAAIIAATTAGAAGAILAMLADTMIPEAFEWLLEFIMKLRLANTFPVGRVYG